MASTEFDLNADDASYLEIRSADEAGKLYYFYHSKRRSLIKSFVLGQSTRTKQLAHVTLIRGDEGRFSPRLEFSTRDTSTSAIESIEEPILVGETRTIKARVDLTEVHENFWKLIGVLESMESVDLPATRYRVVSEDQADLIKAVRSLPRKEAILTIGTALEGGITDEDIALLTNRKASLEEFERLLAHLAAFEEARPPLGANKTTEDVWQDFFERNEWIFGYGLRLVSCEGLTDQKLESTVTGSGLFTGPCKRIDALMRTRGFISSLLFCEIKTPDAQLLARTEYRPSVYGPAEHLRGGVAQVQKTLHKVSLAVSQDHQQLTSTSGGPTGDVVTTVRPRGVVVIGRLSEFNEEHGVNYERFASFELYRSSLPGLEVLTFDELLARAQYILEQYSSKPVDKYEQYRIKEVPFSRDL